MAGSAAQLGSDGGSRRAGSRLGGPIAAIHEGDRVTIDTKNRKLDVEISDTEIKRRLAEWKPRHRATTVGVFAKYAALVTSAAEGAITTPARLGRH